MVDGERLPHRPLAVQLALGFVHDPGQGDLGRGDTPVGAADLQGRKPTVYHVGAVCHGGRSLRGHQGGKAAEVVPLIGPSRSITLSNTVPTWGAVLHPARSQ